uniref:Putative tail protein n=1 Tax=viral metagenome TaxID=1070528 RepID=A0A6M3K5G2_9ZZZZ
MAGTRSRVDLEGFEDLEAAIRKLGEDVQGEILRDAVDAGAEIVRDVASQLAPRDTGFLADHIVKERQWTRTQNTADTYVGPSKEAWYGRFPEMGTTFQPAQPFLRPALDETKNSVIEEVAQQLRRRILREG